MLNSCFFMCICYDYYMKIIISPAKQMQIEEQISYLTTPLLHSQSQVIYSILQKYSFHELQKLYQANDSITQQNIERLQLYDVDKPVTPALFSYVGIQYKYLAPAIMEQEQLDYLQNHLYILSALYGCLRPYDGIIPYRLEAQSDLLVCSQTIYDYFKLDLAKIFKQEDYIVNLASDEYYKMIKPIIQDATCVIHIKFAHEINGKLKVKATDAKMARGRMVQYMANHHITNVKALQNFNELHFEFSEKHSTSNEYIFIKKIP